MAIIKCPECEQFVYDKATVCPHCGFPLNGANSNESDKQQSNEPTDAVSENAEKNIETPDNSSKELITTGVGSDPTGESETKKKKKGKKGLKVFLIVFASVLAALAIGVVIFYFAHTHSFDEWIVSKAATCTEQGEKYHKCKLCFQTFTESIDPIGHNWISATCTEAKHCSRCSQTEGSALGHSWKNATCTTAKKCTRCNKTEGSALGHNYVDYICTRCKDCKVSRSDMPNILDIYNPRYNINYVNGIDHWMTLVNKSSKKTIKYIYLEIEHKNAVGDVLTNEIGRDKSTFLSYTGPLGPGASSGEIYWRAVFYNGNFSGTINFKSIEIEYTDGSKLKIDDYAADGAVVSLR